MTKHFCDNCGTELTQENDMGSRGPAQTPFIWVDVKGRHFRVERFYGQGASLDVDGDICSTCVLDALKSQWSKVWAKTTNT